MTRLFGKGLPKKGVVPDQVVISDNEEPAKEPANSNQGEDLGVEYSFSRKELDKIVKGTYKDRQEFIKSFNFTMLLESFSWTKNSALILDAKLNGHKESRQWIYRH